MTSNVELLPLYAELQGHPKIEIIKHYARANVAHATAAKDAEIEALRAKLDGVRARLEDVGKVTRFETVRAERLAEALRKIEAMPPGRQTLNARAKIGDPKAVAYDYQHIARAALEQENDDA